MLRGSNSRWPEGRYERVCGGRAPSWLCAQLMTAVLVAAGLSVPAQPASAAGEPVVCTGSAPSESVAAAMATECDRRVQVDSQTSQYTRVVALPSALWRLEQTAVPVRVRRGTVGRRSIRGWRCYRTAGSGPKASTVGTRLSWGGRDDLTTLSVTGGSNRPVVAGRAAEAVAGRRHGGVRRGFRRGSAVAGLRPSVFTHVLVVKSAAAATDPALRSIRYGWSVRGLSTSSRTDGGLDISNGSEVVLSVAPGAMWDSTVGSAHVTAAGSKAVARGEAARVAPVDVALSRADLVVAPNLDLLIDSTTVFPVYIDPPVSATGNRWGHSNSANQNRQDWVAGPRTVDAANRARPDAGWDLPI